MYSTKFYSVKTGKIIFKTKLFRTLKTRMIKVSYHIYFENTFVFKGYAMFFQTIFGKITPKIMFQILKKKTHSYKQFDS